MERVTVTLYLKPDSFMPFITALKILSTLDLENNYTIQPLDIIFSEKFNSEYMTINVPVDLFIKFKYCIKKCS